MFCSNCGTAIPTEARFCANCGTAVAANKVATTTGGISWEYKDLEIPLNIEFNLPVLQDQNFVWSQLTETEHQCERIILNHLQLAGKDGWQADEPTDFKTLFRAKRIIRHQTNKAAKAAGTAASVLLLGPFATLLGKSEGVYESVTIRMKRSKPR